MPQRKLILAAWWLLTAILLAAAVGIVAFHTPDEASMGPIQKIFYLHLPVALNTFGACLVVFVASVGYLLQRKSSWDDLASSAAKVAVVLCSVVLITGMLWARGAWGVWWTWSPRLTFSLMLWLLYVVYLIVRNSIDSSQRRAVVSAVYGIIAFLDVPLVYLSARLMPDIHPSSIGLEPAMKLTLAAMFVPVTMATIGLVVTRYLVARAESLKQAEDRARARDGTGEQAVAVPAAGAPASLEKLLRPAQLVHSSEAGRD